MKRYDKGFLVALGGVELTYSGEVYSILRHLKKQLRQHFDIFIALATIHKVLRRFGWQPFIQNPQKYGLERYECPVPGARI